MRILSLLGACTLALVVPLYPTYAQGPEWPDAVEVGELLVLEAPDGVSCSWEISGKDYENDPYAVVFKEFPGVLVVETRYPGSVVITLKTNAQKGMVDIVWGVSIGSGEIDPQPGPEPVPPQPGKIFAVLVEETDDRSSLTPERIGAILSMKTQAYMDAKGYGYRVVDIDARDVDGNPPLEISAFLQRANGQELPRIIIANSAGGILFDDVLPADEAGLLETLSRFGGK